MLKILDGRVPRDFIILKLKKKLRSFKSKPTLAIIQVGNREESNAYIKQKKIFAEKVGVKVRHLKFRNTVSQKELLKNIYKLNRDRSISGIITQLPIPKTLDKLELLRSVNPAKDVDGLNPLSKFIPATARGILSLLDFYRIKLVGNHVVVIGRSMLVGKPTALALLKRDATVTIAHSKTKNLPEICKSANILVVAIGRPKFINNKYVKKRQIVIDVGINTKKRSLKEEILLGKRRILVGDVDFEKVKKIVKAISPVPGGVGAMTVASLFENLISAFQEQRKNI